MATLNGTEDAWAWWADADAIARHTRDLIGAELQALRPGLPWPWPAGQAAQGHLRHELGVDSLELMGLSAALVEACGLRSPEAAAALYADQHLQAWLAVAQQAWQAQPGTVAFRTSGSTGRPRRITHRVDGLQQEVSAVCAHIQSWQGLHSPHGQQGQQGPSVQRVVSVVRCHHIYGFLFTWLLPHAPGWGQPAGQPLPVWDAAGLPVAVVLSQLRAGDLVVAFPDWWRAACRSGVRVPDGVLGVSSTAPCPDELADEVCAMGVTRLLQVYGSTETAGIGWRDAPHRPFALMPHWHAVPLPGGEPDPTRLLRTWPDGQVETIALPDHVRWVAARQLLPAGRVDQAVQVGGVNVHPEAVRQHLLAHPRVADAAVRLHDFAGVPRLKALVVPKPWPAGQPTTDADLNGQLAQHLKLLPPAARPAHLCVAEALPRTPMGKLADWPVAAAASVPEN